MASLRALFLLPLWGCSFSVDAGEPGLAPTVDAMTPTSTQIQFLGDVSLRRDGYVLPVDKVLPGPLDVCAQSYPIGAVARARVEWTTATGEPREVAMAIAADHVGHFGNNTLWCARVDVDARPLALRVTAEDSAGAVARAELAITPHTEIALFTDAADAAAWQMAGAGTFVVDGATLRAQPGSGLGLFWSRIPTPADYVLTVEAKLDRFDDNSGIFVRFRDPETFGYDNAAWVGVHDGLEIQIDETAHPDGADVHRTGAVYEQPSAFVRAPDGVPGVWRRFEVTVRGMHVTVRIDDRPVTDLAFPGDPTRPDRARPSTPGAPRFVGLQAHTGAVSFRNVRLRAL